MSAVGPMADPIVLHTRANDDLTQGPIVFAPRITPATQNLLASMG
jgi:hypothetical protein